jgi:hypothetical protein
MDGLQGSRFYLRVPKAPSAECCRQTRIRAQGPQQRPTDTFYVIKQVPAFSEGFLSVKVRIVRDVWCCLCQLLTYASQEVTGARKCR